ncbi:MAG: hypothetical protein U0798_17550 [Gemmataceae bacterium]
MSRSRLSKITAITKSQRTIRCAIYTRKSTEEGLEQEFNSLDAQRDAAESYIRSQVEKVGSVLPSGPLR